MSPDPPREDSGDDENRIRRFSGDFMEGMMNDDEFFIVPDAPYELDMDDESEYSDSEVEDGGRDAAGGAGSQNSTRTPHVTVMLESDGQELHIHEGQSRGRYRLLIPFPNATTTATDDTSSTNEGRSTDEINQVSGGVARSDAQDINGPDETPENSNSSQPEESSSDKPSTSECDKIKREIELTEEKVEKIKEVMKNITLPSTSIPKWAAEIDEDSWKKKLNDSITSSGRLSIKTDKSASGESSKDKNSK